MFVKYSASIMVLLLLTGCLGENTSENRAGKSGNADSASVVLLLTDAPFEAYDEVNLLLNRVSLLPNENSDPADEIVLYEGSREVNLLDLRHHAELFALKDTVAVGNYRVVRLYSRKNIELVTYGENGETEKVSAQLDYDYIDLITDTPVEVSGGEVTYLEVDIDLEMSMLSYDEGTGTLYFEPVVSMRTFTGESNDETTQEKPLLNDGSDEDVRHLPFISVRGQLREVLPENNEQQRNLLICPSAQAATPACTQLGTNELTQFYSSDLSQIQVEQLVAGTSVMAMGRLTPPNESGQRSVSIYTLIQGQQPNINIRGARIREVTGNQSITLSNGRSAALSENAQIITHEGQSLALEDFSLPAEVTMFGRFTPAFPEKIALLIVKESASDHSDDKHDSDQSSAAERAEVIRAKFDQVLETSPAVYQVTQGDATIRVMAAGARIIVTGSGKVMANNNEQAPTNLDHGASVTIKGVFVSSKADPSSQSSEKTTGNEIQTLDTEETNDSSVKTFVAEHLILHRLPNQRIPQFPAGHPAANAPGRNKD